MFVLIGALLGAQPAWANVTDQPKKAAQKAKKDAERAEPARQGASVKRPVGAPPAKDNPAQPRGHDPLAERYVTDSHSYYREDFGKPWQETDGNTLDKERIRTLKGEVGRLMDKHQALQASTKALHRPDKRTLRVPEQLTLPPSVLAWIGPNLELVPASAGYRPVAGIDDMSTWSMSAAAVDLRGDLPRAAAFRDRRVIEERSTITVDGTTYVQFDATGRPVKVARVGTEAGNDGCKTWKETQLWSLSWTSAGVLSTVEDQAHYACAHRESEEGWASYRESTTRIRR